MSDATVDIVGLICTVIIFVSLAGAAVYRVKYERVMRVVRRNRTELANFRDSSKNHPAAPGVSGAALDESV